MTESEFNPLAALAQRQKLSVQDLEADGVEPGASCTDTHSSWMLQRQRSPGAWQGEHWALLVSQAALDGGQADEA